MIFPSFVFLFVFLPIVLFFWLSKIGLTYRLSILTLASYVFYGWWDYRFVTLLLISTFVDYLCGLKINQSNNNTIRKKWLTLSIFTNLSILGFFKYFDFFSANLSIVAQSFGIESHLPILHIILPLGISFYTFQSISYTIDIYRNDAKPAQSLLHFACYISLFPQLIAGPIVRYQLMDKQINQLDRLQVSARLFAVGLFFFIIGMSKKVLIADTLSPLSNQLFDNSISIKFFTSWIGSIAYSLQLYFDFSGYSDMAIGLGMMLGFRLPINFNSPYQSSSISEFWNRWHITLSNFLRDYLYIPLGGSKKGTLLTLRNVTITMFLGGLWHGAGWTFICWGLYHGALLSIHNIWKRLSLFTVPKFIAVASTFLLVNFSWVLFRSPDFSKAKEIFTAMFGFNGYEPIWQIVNVSETFGNMPMLVNLMGGLRTLPIYLIALFIIWFTPNTNDIKKKLTFPHALWLFILFFACLLSIGSHEELPFLYFDF